MEKLYLMGGYYDAPVALVRKNGTTSYYSILRDHLGSITRVIASNQSNIYGYDAWGRMRNLSMGTLLIPENESAPSLGRGFCGHEHLTGFGLINMNARLYDPMLGRFLSPDPYVQAPEHSQSFNRYSYCMNNPLIYKDTDGEFLHLIIGAVIGGVINLALNAKNISNFWQGLGYFGIGAASGALSAGIGSGVNVAMAGGSFGAGFMGSVAGVSSTGFISGALVGASSGFAGGFVTTSGNAWMGGASFGDSLWSGIKAGGIGALAGGAIGGIAGGIDALTKRTNFWTGNATIDLSNAYAASGTTIGDNTITGKYVGKFEGVDVYEKEMLGDIHGNYSGITIPERGIIVGKGVFTSGIEEGRAMMQHEYGHIMQYLKVGPKAYYSIIAPESLASATFTSMESHHNFWTETWANYLSKGYFGLEWLGNKVNGYPAKNISWFNVLRLASVSLFL